MKRVKGAVSDFLKRKGSPFGFALARVYRHWPDIVGHEIAAMAHPLGHRKRALILGVTDSVTMQELSLYAPLILERIEEYLGENHFDNLKFELLKGRVPLDTVRLETPPSARIRRKPGALGRLTDGLDPDSPVARCYRTFVRAVTGEDHSETR